MKKYNKLLTSILIACLMILSLTACGSSKRDSYKAGASANDSYAMYDAMPEAAYDYAEEEMLAEVPASGASKEIQDTSRKLIKNVDLTVETENMDSLMMSINDRITFYGGYIEYSNVFNGSSKNSKKNASIVARVPAVKLDEFLDNVSEESNITRQNINVTDVTLQYVDLEARKSSLDTQQKRLLELMEKAETVEDIIVIEERLGEIRYELESAERQIRSYDNQVDYSTVNIDISEVEKYTPVKERTRLEKMGEGFVESIYDVCENFLDFIVGLVIALPHLVVFAIFVVIIVLIIRAIIKHEKKKKEKKLKERQAAFIAQQQVAAQQENGKQ